MATIELQPLDTERSEMNQLQEDGAEAVRTAIQRGTPLHQIEEYLDWLDLVRPAATR